MKKIALLLLISFNALCSPHLKVGDKAPDFTLTDPSGRKISLNELRGKVVLLDFWASWCGPCRVANKELTQFYKDFNPQGFEIFSVSLDSKKEPWLAAIEKDGLVWPYHGSDFKEWDSAPAQLFGIDALPTTYLLDESGTIILKSYDVKEIEKKLNYVFFEETEAYPLNVVDTIYFPVKSKYEIANAEGKIVLRGKETSADIAALPAGQYLLNYEEKMTLFNKIDKPASPVSFSERDGKLMLSREAVFEIYTPRGKLLKKGKAKEIPVGDLKTGAYLVNTEGKVSSYIKK